MDDCKSNGFIIWTYEKTIRKHINNIFVDKELEYFNNTQKMRVVGVKLLHELYPGVLEKRYGVSEEYIDDYITHLGKEKKLYANKEIDINRVCMLILNDLRNGSLGNITLDRIQEDINE